MSEYRFPPTTKTILPTFYVQEKKAARRKLLDEVEQRRQKVYKRCRQNMLLRGENDGATIV